MSARTRRAATLNEDARLAMRANLHAQQAVEAAVLAAPAGHALLTMPDAELRELVTLIARTFVIGFASGKEDAAGVERCVA